MKVAVIGTGFVGITSAACLSRVHEVIGYDVDEGRILQLKSHKLPFFEPGLQEEVTEGLDRFRSIHGVGAPFSPALNFTNVLGDAIRDAEVILVSVGTPSKPDGSADVSAVLHVAETIRNYLRTFNIHSNEKPVVVLRSTSPVGTGDRVAAILEGLADVAVNPEFLAEGTAVRDFLNPSRIVVGTTSMTVNDKLQGLYDLCGHSTPVKWYMMDRRSAEMTKYAANAALALRISFINDIAAACDALGADVRDVAEGIGADPRIGAEFLRAGAGFGGSCFTKDLKAIIAMAPDISLPTISATLERNELQRVNIARRVLELTRKTTRRRDPHIVILGRAFKPDTSDERDSIGLDLKERFEGWNCKVTIHDPTNSPTRMELEGADAIVLVTEWEEFVTASWLDELKQGALVYDARNVFDRATVIESGHRYEGIGRGKND